MQVCKTGLEGNEFGGYQRCVSKQTTPQRTVTARIESEGERASAGGQSLVVKSDGGGGWGFVIRDSEGQVITTDLIYELTPKNFHLALTLLC